MKQILYIPSGSYFLFYDILHYPCKPTISAEQVLKVYPDWYNMITVEDVLDKIINKKIFNLDLYVDAGIDINHELQLSEFEIIEE